MGEMWRLDTPGRIHNFLLRKREEDPGDFTEDLALDQVAAARTFEGENFGSDTSLYLELTTILRRHDK